MTHRLVQRLIGWALLLAWPVTVLSLNIQESIHCGWNRGLWQDAVCKSPLKPRPRLNLAHAYEKIGRYDLAIQEYENAIRLSFNPDRLESERDVGWLMASQNVGQIYIKFNDYKSAGRVLMKAWNNYIGHPGLAINLSTVLIEENRPDIALEVLDSALELGPRLYNFPDLDYFRIHLNRAASLLGLGRCQESRLAYQKAKLINRELDLTEVLKIPCEEKS